MFTIIYSIINFYGGENMYRRINSRDAWHFCKNCSKWPTTNYVERSTKPTTDELCDECKSKQKNNICKK